MLLAGRYLEINTVFEETRQVHTLLNILEKSYWIELK